MRARKRVGIVGILLQYGGFSQWRIRINNARAEPTTLVPLHAEAYVNIILAPFVQSTVDLYIYILYTYITHCRFIQHPITFIIELKMHFFRALLKKSFRCIVVIKNNFRFLLYLYKAKGFARKYISL